MSVPNSLLEDRFPKSSLPSLRLPFRPLSWKNTPDRQLWSRVALSHRTSLLEGARRPFLQERILVKVTLEELKRRWCRYGAVHLSHQMLCA